jgi:hypothetical protein
MERPGIREDYGRGMQPVRRRVGAGLVVLGLTVTLATDASATSRSAAPRQATGGTVWLCRPGLADDPCTSDLTTTVVRPDGSTRVVHTEPAKHPPVDCFYVYPTVSGQPGPNADLTIDPEIRAIAETQASRFSQVCRVFAPVYRQLTVAAIRDPAVTRSPAAVTAYLDVQRAWDDYLANDNHGRGVVVIGHSQGAVILTALLRRVVDPDPALRARIVGALLLGGNVTVAPDQDVGGSFQHLPACRRAREAGCVVAYSTFDEDPPPDARYGRSDQGEVLCVNPANPAAPTGGDAPLLPFFRTTPFPGPLGGNRPSAYQAPTPWVELPRLYRAHCAQRDGAAWLQVDDVGAATDSRPRVQAVLGPAWGLHLVDVGVTLGDLVRLARAQAATYVASQNDHTGP